MKRFSLILLAIIIGLALNIPMAAQASPPVPVWGDESAFNEANTEYTSVAALSSTKFVVAYRDVGNSNKGTARVCTVSGTDITSWGSEYVFNNANTKYISVAKLSSDKFVVVYNEDITEDSSKAKAIVGHVSGTNIDYWGGESEDERHSAGFRLIAPIGVRARQVG